MDADALDPRLSIGGNHPPIELEPEAPATPDPLAAITAHVDDLYTEACNWCDGAEIENEAQGAEVDRLLADFRDAIIAAETARDDEIAPLNEQVKAIREKWYPLIADTTKLTGSAIRARKALLAVKTRWATKLEALRAAEARRLRDEAAQQAAEAQAALKAAPDNLAAVESAEDMIRNAQNTLREAKRAEQPATKGMRTEVRVIVANELLAIRTMLERHHPEMLAAALQLAERDAREGKRQLAGFTITEEKVAFR